MLQSSSSTDQDQPQRFTPSIFHPGWGRRLLLSIITGALAGGLIAAFRLAVAAGEAGRVKVWDVITVTSAGSVILGPLLVAALAALGGIITRWEPKTAGGGVYPVRAALAGEIPISCWPQLPAKFMASFFTLVSGLSLGREGPAVFLGGATGQAVGSWFRSDEAEAKHLLACGAAAAVAAAFGAPFTGLLFVWEELKYSSLQSFFVPGMAAVMVATKVAAYFLGPGAVLSWVQGPDLPAQALLLFLLLGFSLGLLGIVFNHGLSFARQLFARFKRCPKWLRPALAALPVAWVALFMSSDLLGSGQALLSRAAAGQDKWAVVAVLLVTKLVLTIISAASGASGGVFLPLLSVGALMGCLWGHVAPRCFAGIAFSPQFVAAGMAAAFGGMLRLPFTGLILVFELTGSYSYENLLYYLAAILIAYQVRESGEKLMAKRQQKGATAS